MIRRSVARSCGVYTPANCVSNDKLAEKIDTSDDWIRARTGIRQRYLAADGEQTSDLGTAAAVEALRRAGIDANEVDLIVVATSTPDNTFPATATAIQQKLGCGTGIAFDVQAVCAGFAYALNIADLFLKTGQAETALVIGAETFSRILDWSDRGTCVLFGDGAGALLLQAEAATGGGGDRGVLSSYLAADGGHYDALYVDGGAATGKVGHLRMNGGEVFKHAVRLLSDATERAVTLAGASLDDIDWLVPHQANRRIIDGVGKRLKLPAEKVVISVDRHANTSAASIPLALDVALSDGRVQRGDLLVLTAMGGGFAWGAVTLRW